MLSLRSLSVTFPRYGIATSIPCLGIQTFGFRQDSYNLFVEGLCAHHVQDRCSKATCNFLHKDLDEIFEVLNELVEGVEEQFSDAASSFVCPVAMEACDAAVQMHMACSEQQASVDVMRYQ